MLSQKVKSKITDELSLAYAELDLIKDSINTLEDSEGELLFNHLVENRNKGAEQ